MDVIGPPNLPIFLARLVGVALLVSASYVIALIFVEGQIERVMEHGGIGIPAIVLMGAIGGLLAFGTFYDYDTSK